MKALSPSKRPTLLVILISAIVAILIGVGAYTYFANRLQDTTSTPQRTIKGDQVTDNPQSQSNLPPKTGESSDDTVLQPSTETPSTPPEKPTIERAGGNPTIKVVATFQKASSGYCELQLSQAGQQTSSYTSKIIVSSSYYICSFSIARSTLPAGGTWGAVVIHHVGTASTASDAKGIE